MSPKSRQLIPPPAPLLLLATLLLIPGCDSVSTISSRTKEMSASFAEATVGQRALAEKGLIDRGFSSGLVFIALDKPDRVQKSPDGRNETWVYANFDGNLVANAAQGAAKVTQTSGPTQASASSAGSGRAYQNYSTGSSTAVSEAAAAGRDLHVVFVDGRVSVFALR